MAYDFGNIYGMTKQEFETAISYYQNKISQMEGDYSINPGAKRWFLKRYNERVRKLVESYKDLQEVINTAKESGYVNESTATLNSLNGTASVDNSQFADMKQTPRKHRWGQFFRVLGAILLPVVGTIPLTISAVRSRRRFKAVQNALRQENIDMNNFVNETNRSHDAGIGTSPSFTEEEMKNLLSHPAEIDRLEALTNPADPALSPAEKAVLVKKLSTLKAYGQNNGYKFVTTTPANNSEIKALTDTKFNTSVDKISAGLAAVITPTNLEEARNVVLELKALKTQAESLRIEGGDNRLIDSLISKINAEISTNMGKAQTFIDNGYTSMNGSLLAAAAPNMSITDEKARYNDSNSRLDGAYSAVEPLFGTDVATARSYADELGLATDKFENLKNTYDSSKANNNNKLAEISARETFDNQLADIEAKLLAIESKIAGWATTPPTAPEMVIALGELNYIKGVLAAAKPYADAHSTEPLFTDYTDKSSRYTLVESEFNKYQHILDVNATNFDTFANMISVTNKPVITIPWNSGDDDKSTLITKKSNIQAALAIIDGTPNIDQIMANAGRTPDLINIRQLAAQYVREIDERITYYDKDLPKYKRLVNDNKPESPDSITTLLTKRSELQVIKSTIDNPTYRNGMDAEVSALVSDIDRYIDNINVAVKPYEDLVAEIKDSDKKVKTIVKRKNPSVDQLEADLQVLKAIVASLTAQSANATTWGIIADLTAVVDAANTYLSAKTLNKSSTATMTSHHP